MEMSLRKGRRDFGERLIRYAIEGGVIARCPDHAGSVFRTDEDIASAHAVVEAAWKSGEIGSGLDGAIDQLNSIIEKAPKTCSQLKCWSKG